MLPALFDVHDGRSGKTYAFPQLLLRQSGLALAVHSHQAAKLSVEQAGVGRVHENTNIMRRPHQNVNMPNCLYN